MSVDYAALADENRLEYGTGIGRIGKMLLEDRYDKRTHFLYEVLQNAEDALRRREGEGGSRCVRFALTRKALRISHFGAPFTESDVRGVCGINASNKDLTSIGRFGIGFKSVYAFTDRPEVYSGDEAFSIADYVLPGAIPSQPRELGETLIILPLRDTDGSAFDEIAGGLRTLGAEALLFLKHVEEIVWSAEGVDDGTYRRITTGKGFRREVELLTAGAAGADSRREPYLLFSRDVKNEGLVVGQAELAFRIESLEGQRSVRPIADARLAVFFPTVLPTHTGFLIQGPYQTTPSRDNIPADKPWNASLAAFTGDLLVDVLEHLKAEGQLSVAALRALPLERLKLAGGLFQPLYDRTLEALRTRRLLPANTGRFATAPELRIARTQDVRELFGPKQLGALWGNENCLYWTSAEITADRAPDLRNFLMQDLKVAELTLDQVLARIGDGFFAEQTDAWMQRFYKLLASQPALVRGRARDMALYRLEDGRHVPLMKHGLRQVFLPTGEKTGFPTLRASLLTEQTRKFLAVTLTKPDPVDDVIRNLLPNYRQETVDTDNYAEDIERMLRAFSTDSQTQRDKLIAALKGANIVMVKDAATGDKFINLPGDVYLAAARMTKLFNGVTDVMLVDTSYECLRGEKIREMLEACGATRILRATSCHCDLPEDRKLAIRRAAGWEGSTSETSTDDIDVAGLAGLLALLPSLPIPERVERARLLWEAVGELIERRGASVLSVQYRWFYHQPRAAAIDAKFIRRLIDTPWIPDAAGVLRRPAEILFVDLGWPANPLLEARIAFKPPAVAALAREVGIDPDVLDELKRLGVTDLAQLRDRLKVEVELEADAPAHDNAPSGADAGTAGDEAEVTASISGADGNKSHGAQTDSGGVNNGTSTGASDCSGGGSSGPGSQAGRSGGGNGGGTREFVSYVGTRPEGEHGDPDGLTQQQRMKLEEAAIEFILTKEPKLERTAAGNKGFDLIDNDLAGEPQRWIEVKAMKGSLQDRPVGLSKAQMDHARRSGDQYWLYVVEQAGSSGARILKIRNPHGAVGTFTFDRGWEAIATIVPAGPTDETSSG